MKLTFQNPRQMPRLSYFYSGLSLGSCRLSSLRKLYTKNGWRRRRGDQKKNTSRAFVIHLFSLLTEHARGAEVKEVEGWCQLPHSLINQICHEQHPRVYPSGHRPILTRLLRTNYIPAICFVLDSLPG